MAETLRQRIERIEAAEVADPGLDASPPPGLVSFSTSDTGLISQGLTDTKTPGEGPVVVVDRNDVVLDPVLGRLRRMRSAILTAARLIQERLGASGQRWKPAMLHLTYGDEAQFDGRQISDLLKRIREWARRRGLPTLPYVWVLERGSKNGRLHYHILIWLPKGVTLPKPDKQGWWPWGHTRIEWARKSAVGYIAKYLSKGSPEDASQGAFPKHSRMHGKGGLNGVERSKCAWWRAPKWVKQVWPNWEDEPRPRPGGGWVSRVRGDWLPSPWRLIGFEKGRPVIRWVGDGPCSYALEGL